jgi:N-acetylglucosamine-6-phosphate deacetylase
MQISALFQKEEQISVKKDLFRNSEKFTGGSRLGLEEALQEHEERVDTLLKSANRYVSALT